MSKATTVFDEIAHCIYNVHFFGDDSSFMENKLLEIREKNKTIFDRVLLALLRDYPYVVGCFSEDFREKYIDNSEDL